MDEWMEKESKQTGRHNNVFFSLKNDNRNNIKKTYLKKTFQKASNRRIFRFFSLSPFPSPTRSPTYARHAM
jgi:hypothetical protein